MSYATSAPALPKSAAPPSISNHFKAAIKVPFLPSPGTLRRSGDRRLRRNASARGSSPANSVTCRLAWRLPRLLLGRRAALPLHPIQRIAEYARANCAVPRATSVRAGILRAVAGRIIKNAVCSDNQSSPAAVATANIVAIASVANSSVAFIVCLPTCTPGNRTPTTNLTLLIRQGLLRFERQTDVGTDIRRVAPDAPFAFSATPRGCRLWGSEAGSGRWPARRFYMELLTLFFLAPCIRFARGALRFLRLGIFSPPLSQHFPSIRHAKDIQLVVQKTLF